MLRRFLSGGIFRAARRSAGSGQRFSAVSRYARNAGVHSCDRGGSIARKSSVVGKPFGAIRSPRVPSVNGCRRMDYAPGCSVVGDAGLRLINFVGRNFKFSCVTIRSACERSSAAAYGMRPLRLREPVGLLRVSLFFGALVRSVPNSFDRDRYAKIRMRLRRRAKERACFILRINCIHLHERLKENTI